MKVLVTGGAGYIGSVLVRELLANGHSVRALDNLMFGGDSLLAYFNAGGFEFIHADIRNYNMCKRAFSGIDAVVHLAAIVGDPASQRQPELTTEINVEGSKNILNLAIEAKLSKLIFVSTCSNYGKSDVSTTASEESPLNPVSLYAQTKVEIELSTLYLPVNKP